MKKLLLAGLSLLSVSAIFAQANICDTTGNIIIYSNYDGGPLTINVDQNIPNLKIGIVSYEYATITISGAYAGNVTAVRWAGYNGTNNHCNGQPPYTTSISGVPNSVDTMILYPASTYSNPNGYTSIICNYSCSTTTSQGGCNTADQIAHYFQTVFGGTMRYHHTQYGCWQGVMAVSQGGNCCANPISLNVQEPLKSENISVYPNPAEDVLNIRVLLEQPADIRVEMMNALGQQIMIWNEQNSWGISESPSLTNLPEGIYQLRFTAGNQSMTKTVSVIH